MAGIKENFNKLSDFEKLAHANWYTKEQKKKIELLNNRIEILLNLNKSLRKQVSAKDKLLKKYT
jgi:cell shape-determining protein MreC